jgi:iron complex transport system ATP-binding protein
MNSVLEARKLTLSYGETVVAPDISLVFDKPEIVGIIGPNGSGKSTLLKAMSRLLKPASGQVFLMGEAIERLPREKVAQWMSVLPQGAQAPGDYVVHDLVACGRTPYRSAFGSLSQEDRRVIDESIAMVGLQKLAFRRMDSLSGGERQRAWLALALAQQSSVLMLDEPTTYLDVHHQLEMLNLIQRLQQELSLTVIMVLHDLNQAIRFCHRIIAIKEGAVFAAGSVEEVITSTNMQRLYGVESIVTSIAHEGHSFLVCYPHNVCATAS